MFVVRSVDKENVGDAYNGILFWKLKPCLFKESWWNWISWCEVRDSKFSRINIIRYNVYGITQTHTHTCARTHTQYKSIREDCSWGIEKWPVCWALGSREVNMSKVIFISKYVLMKHIILKNNTWANKNVLKWEEWEAAWVVTGSQHISHPSGKGHRVFLSSHEAGMSLRTYLSDLALPSEVIFSKLSLVYSKVSPGTAVL